MPTTSVMDTPVPPVGSSLGVTPAGIAFPMVPLASAARPVIRSVTRYW